MHRTAVFWSIGLYISKCSVQGQSQKHCSTVVITIVGSSVVTTIVVSIMVTTMGYVWVLDFIAGAMPNMLRRTTDLYVL